MAEFSYYAGIQRVIDPNAVMDELKDFYNIQFIDFEGSAHGDAQSMREVVEKAEDCLHSLLTASVMLGEPIPEPSSTEDIIEIPEGASLILITVDIDLLKVAEEAL